MNYYFWLGKESEDIFKEAIRRSVTTSTAIESNRSSKELDEALRILTKKNQ